MQKTSALHESPANGSVLIMLMLLQLATKDAVYYLEGQKKKKKKISLDEMVHWLQQSTHHRRILVYSKKKKQIHVCACTYKNPQEDILRFSIMAQSIKAYIFRKYINVFYENTSIAVKSWSTSQIICTMYEGVTLFLRNRF